MLAGRHEAPVGGCLTEKYGHIVHILSGGCKLEVMKFPVSISYITSFLLIFLGPCTIS